MRITNWKHFPWFVFVFLATIAACILYIGNFHPHLMPAGFRLPASLIQKTTEHHTVGGTPLGLAFGAISLGIFVFAALLSLRKKIPLWRIGTVQRWLRAHIWLTFLTIPLVILHSGFRLGGSMTTLLMVLYAIVMVSGIYGLVLQNYIPRLMKERLPAETVFEQIPHIRSQLCVAAEKMRDSFKPAPPKKTEAAAPAAGKAAATAVMAATKGELSTPTARPKSATGSVLTAAPVTGASSSPAAQAPKEEAATGGSESGHGPPAGGHIAAPEVSGKSSESPNEEASTKAAAANAATPVESKPADTVSAAATQEQKEPQTPPAASAVKPVTPVAKPASAPVAKPAAAAKPVAATDPASEAMLVEFIDRQILPYLRARRGERLRFGKARFSDDTFRFVKLGVSEAYRSRVEEIQGWCDERRLLDLQTRLHHWLHGWLIIHVPFSFLLLMLTIWHACVTLFNY